MHDTSTSFPEAAAIAAARTGHIVRSSPIDLEGVVDAIDHGLLLVDANARVLFANRSACEVLEAGHALACEDGIVTPAVHSQRHAWRRTLARLSAGDSAIVDLSSSIEPMHVTLNAIGEIPGCAPGMHVIAIGMAPSPAAWQCRIAAFARHYRLTRAEVRVLSDLLDDHPPRQIACRLGVSVSTVRTHLRHVLQKTAASSLRRLTAMVFRMPPVLWDEG